MGADVIVSGLQDAVVETMVELGMTLPNIHAVLDLDDALALSRTNQHNGSSTTDQNGTGPLDYAHSGALPSDLTEAYDGRESI